MWTKLSNALKQRGDGEQHQPTQQHQRQPPQQQEQHLQAPQTASTSQSKIVTKLREQHPNLSMFDQQPDVPFPAPSPPGSPSKHGKLGIFKRTSKANKNDEPIPSLKLPMFIPKKVKSTLNLNSNNSSVSLPPRPSIESQRSSSDAPRPSNDSQRTVNSPHPPVTPIEPRRTKNSNNSGGSVRSIMREKNTPGTGASVRFFSRDAYRIITPDSSSSNAAVPETFVKRLQHASPEPEETRFFSATASPGDGFSPPALTSVFDNSPPGLPMIQSSPSLTDLLTPIPPPEFTDLFDMSQEHEVENIPVSNITPLRDNAVEVSELDESLPLHDVADTNNQTEQGKVADAEEPSPVDSSFSASSKARALGPKAGESIFHSLRESPGERMRSASSLGLYKLFGSDKADANTPTSFSSSRRHRSTHSDEFVVGPARNTSLSELPPILPAQAKTKIANMKPKNPKNLPEFEIHDEIVPEVKMYEEPSNPPSPGLDVPDPFRMNATTYYTPETCIPNSPPRSKHSKSSSNSSAGSNRSDESMINTLRTQLALQQDLATQYEADLRARDELVSVLQARIDSAEKDADKRRSMMRSWKKKISDLEKACRVLEEEVNDSRQASFERSVMDEASGEALRQLHRQIGLLEREKGEVEKREGVLAQERDALSETLQNREREIGRLRDELGRRVDAEKSLEEGIQQAKVQMDLLGVQTPDQSMDVTEFIATSEHAVAHQQKRRRENDSALEEERARLESLLSEMQSERDTLRSELSQFEFVKAQLTAKEEEVQVLKDEVEAQWRSTEANVEKLNELDLERDELRIEVEALENRICEMESEWNDAENRRAEMSTEVNDVWTAKEAIESEKAELSSELASARDQLDQSKRDLAARDSQISTLQQEHQFARDETARLENLLRQRNAELSESTQHISSLSQELEDTNAELSRIRREYNRQVESHGRDQEDVARREEDMRTRMEDAVRQKAQVDVELSTLRERAEKAKEETEKLRRQVHELKVESADREMKLMELQKKREQDKEDRLGLNIALDSKQQELELLKRKMGVRGTGGSTPAPPSRAGNRRESGIFTPVPMRPPSSLSEAGSESIKRSETPSTLGRTSSATAALGRSTKVNGSASTSVAPPSALKSARFVDGSMGPPPAPPSRPRASVGSMSTGPSAMSRSASSRPGSAMGVHRRGSSTPLEHETSMKNSLSRSTSVKGTVKEIEEKENARPRATPTPTKVLVSRRTSMVASPA
ncbi:hypothetical protein BD410DRAFT_819072 [Rickenella mellea]|uniref:Uncharacterized protein n=1 Tax=Rickenella mellea TaxID=50990 RepID=A0A4Y7QGT6_9AGAM|nr:hypothetical protein BD410DRAFT_819072 [Rickenella mellea]